ncbi:MAG: SipW-dependent-type signal peptide-containing protein [Promicromonosporaceae bacterium]|nr:SipW-dependent-type signal peptide-containing protein [Promicromonosporaceae bacterium]
MNAPVIVVTEEKKRRKGLLWMAGITAGAVALVGGGTFALWSASADFEGGAITAGDLNLVLNEASGMFDISEDRTDKGGYVPGTDIPGHAFEAEDWRAVPGDTVAMSAVLDITMVGDNLVAALEMELDDAAEALDNPFWTWYFSIFIDDEAMVFGEDAEGDDITEVPFDLSTFTGDVLHIAYLTTDVLTDGVYHDDTVDELVFSVGEDGETVVTVLIIGRFWQAGDDEANNYDGTIGAQGGNNVTIPQIPNPDYPADSDVPTINDPEFVNYNQGRNMLTAFEGMAFNLQQVRHTGAYFN